MTVAEAIFQADKLKPNAYDQTEKVRWLSELDGQIAREILGRSGGPGLGGYDPEEPEAELIADGAYADLYIKYLCAQIDYHNGEWTRYNNSAAMFQAAWDAYAAYMRRTFLPKPGAKILI